MQNYYLIHFLTIHFVKAIIFFQFLFNYLRLHFHHFHLKLNQYLLNSQLHDQFNIFWFHWEKIFKLYLLDISSFLVFLLHQVILKFSLILNHTISVIFSFSSNNILKISIPATMSLKNTKVFCL